VLVTRARRRYPTPPTIDSGVRNAVLSPTRSDIQHTATTTKNEARYGGAERPWARIEVKPMSVRMTGRKTGRLEYETLQEK
jgi:hypothetical protein